VIGEHFYNLLARDTPLLEPLFFARIPAAAAAAAIVVSFNIPNDKVLLLRGCAVFMLPGAAQFPLRVDMSLTSTQLFSLANAVVWAKSFTTPPPAAATGVSDTWSGEVLAPPGVGVQVTATFNAGVANNAMSATVFGFLLPRGNLTAAIF